MNLVNTVESLLQSKNFTTARDEIMKPDNLSSIQTEEMELISKLCDIGLHEAEAEEEIFACSDALKYISQHSNPKLALVSVLEQAESFMYSSKFGIVLNSLQILLSRDTLKRSKLYSWTFELLNKHIKLFHGFPKELNNKLCEGKEALLLEHEPQIVTILQFYKEVCDFYEPLLKDHVRARNVHFARASESKAEDRDAITKKGNIFRSNLIELLGAPLIYFDLSWSADGKEEKDNVKTEARLIAERLMGFLSDVNLDSSYYMKWIDYHVTRYKSKPMELEEGEEMEEDLKIVDEDEERIQMTSLGNCLYLIYIEKLSLDQMPMAYFPAFLFHAQLPVINSLLREKLQNYSVIQKGLSLALKLISELNEPLNSDMATHEDYNDFVQTLVEYIVFCDSKPIRQFALKVLTSYFLAFDPRGKYMFLQRIWSTVDHSGLKGYMIGQMKDCVVSALSEPQNEELRSYFLGDKLLAFLVQICRLDEGATTDLMRSSDVIIGVLNFLRFLLLRDGVQNESKILDGMKRAETELLKPLQTALDLSEAHYKLKLNELLDPTYTKPVLDLSEMKVSLEVEGQEMFTQDIPVEQQVMAVRSALITFDLMKSLLVRVNECYSKSQSGPQ